MLKNASKGFAAAKAAQADAQASRRRFIPTVRVAEDNPAVVIFNGDPDEPLNLKVHSLTFRRRDGSEGYDKLYCSLEETGECRGHELNASGDKRVGPVSDVGAFSVIDIRWHGRVKADKTDQNGDPIYFLNPLPESVASPYEDPPESVKYKGKKYQAKDIVRNPKSQLLQLSNRWVTALGEQDASWRCKCANCGKGKITIEGYKVGKKVLPEPPDDEDAEYETVYSCHKCEDPKPGGIFSGVPVVIKKQGKGTSTVYAFDQDFSAELDDTDWMKNIKPRNLDEDCAPTGAGRYDELLGTGGKDESGAKKAKKKVVEEEDDETPDEDDDSLFNKTKKSSEDDEPREKPKKSGGMKFKF